MSELKLEVGKVYKARNRSLRLITIYYPEEKFSFSDGEVLYQENGMRYLRDESEFDLIEEYKPEEKVDLTFPESANAFAQWVYDIRKDHAEKFFKLIETFVKENKNEEPKFKVGDQVIILKSRQKGEIVFIDENIYYSPVLPFLIVYKYKEILTAEWFNGKDIMQKVESE